jgi:hypothetical protein
VRDSSSDSSDAMDRYLFKNNYQKSAPEFTKLGPAVCIFGKSGIGKTWAVRKALSPRIELTSDILKSKQDTIDFLNKISGTESHVVIDEYECIHDLVGLREITAPPTNGLFVVVSQIPVKFNFEIVTYNFPVLGPSEIKALFPDAKDEVIANCGGDLRWVKQSLTFTSDYRDDFQGPKEFLTSLVSRSSNINPVNFCGHPIQEPGNIASILHENYIDSKGDIAKIADQLSVADIIESRVYGGDWELLSYFNIWSCILPAVEINHSLSNNLRPGSTWTKYQNACMRAKKIANASSRIPHMNLCVDSLLLLRSYVEKGNFEAFFEYGLGPADLDIMNHLSPLNKLKAKAIASLKKQCLRS